MTGFHDHPTTQLNRGTMPVVDTCRCCKRALPISAIDLIDYIGRDGLFMDSHPVCDKCDHTRAGKRRRRHTRRWMGTAD